MNDDFLYRLRKDPPLSFALRLKAKLRQQGAAAPARRRPTLRILLAVFLVGGSALAATLLAVKGPTQLSNIFRENDPPPVATKAAPQIKQPFATNQREVRGDGPMHTFIDAEPAPAAETMTDAASSSETAGSASSTTGSSAGTASRAAGAQSTSGGQVGPARDAVKILAAASAHAIAELAKPRALSMAHVAPIVEKSDNTRAVQALCGPAGSERPDVVITSRPMFADELDSCRRNDIRDIVDAKFGYRAVVVARAKTGTPMSLSPRELFLAMARQVPSAGNSRVLIDNPYKYWHQINPALESHAIEIWGPAPESSTSTAFAEFVLEPGCDSYDWISALRNSDRTQYDEICHSLREDGVYTEVIQTNILVSQRIWSEPNAVVLLDYQFFDRNRSSLLGNLLQGVDPTRESIFSGTYPGARSMHLLLPRDTRTSRFSARSRFVEMFLSDYFLGASSLEDVLVPLDRDARESLRAKALR